MSSYIIPDSITPGSIKPGVVTVETIEAIMDDAGPVPFSRSLVTVWRAWT